MAEICDGPMSSGESSREIRAQANPQAGMLKAEIDASLGRGLLLCPPRSFPDFIEPTVAVSTRRVATPAGRVPLRQDEMRKESKCS